MKLRGIVLAGGFGTRLLPMTRVTNKHLLPVYDQPMIYYPINLLVNAGIKDILVVTGSESAGAFIDLLGDGTELNCRLTYRTQRGAGGIAEALSLARDFAQNDKVCVILGDNIFVEPQFKSFCEYYDKKKEGAMVLLHEVPDPQRFGVATIYNDQICKIEEKPKHPETPLAVTGCYFYDQKVWEAIKTLKPSRRGELEITDVNNYYLEIGQLDHAITEGFWSDAGTVESLFTASQAMREYKKNNN